MRSYSMEHKICIFPKILEKICLQYPKLAKIISISPFKIRILHAKFWTISCNKIWHRTIIRMWGKTEKQLPLFSYTDSNCIIIILNNIYFAYKFLCILIQLKLRSAYPENSGKVWLQRDLSSNFHQKLIKINLCQDNAKSKISQNSVLSYSCHKIFVAYTQTDRHFPEIVKLCSLHPFKNRKWKICTKPILSSVYIEENKICGYYTFNLLFYISTGKY